MDECEVIKLISQVVILYNNRYGINKFYILPTDYIYAFLVFLRKKILFPYTAQIDLLL
jgi:hypothetical protein